MDIGLILYVTGMVLGIGFAIAMCVRVVLEMGGHNVSSENVFINVFTKIALVYGIIVFIYIMGRIAK